MVHCLCLVARHQVAVQIERDRDVRVPRAARQRLRVDAGTLVYTRRAFNTWRIVVAILFHPTGLLVLLAEKRTERISVLIRDEGDAKVEITVTSVVVDRNSAPLQAGLDKFDPATPEHSRDVHRLRSARPSRFPSHRVVLLDSPEEQGVKRIVVLAIVAAVGVAFPAAAEAGHKPYVLCGNFGGYGMPPHLDRRPHRCDVTHRFSVDRLRHMRWARWKKHAVGRGKVNGKQHTVRFKGTRPCGQFGEFQVYSKMSIDGRPFHPILHCGD